MHYIKELKDISYKADTLNNKNKVFNFFVYILFYFIFFFLYSIIFFSIHFKSRIFPIGLKQWRQFASLVYAASLKVTCSFCR